MGVFWLIPFYKRAATRDENKKREETYLTQTAMNLLKIEKETILFCDSLHSLLHLLPQLVSYTGSDCPQICQ